ncbi:rab-like protein 6 [Saccoglossus kowalevskii]|uniref:Rab-like protein 6-like isoform X1 n=1 Tax=Saccoglossus kowalevskii TaxID=10224 RepID=A0ABM0GYN1_SACKO|nr:PREDICTED: rab-like protein 6-like isoform X1 [Saccoglossus kowalevskii]
MFSALKKLVGSDAHNKGTVPSGMQAMGQNLQRRFAKGVQYNMKIIIKGDRNTGKTTLFQRLQGQKFMEEYIPTQEIQVASIQWSYKNTDDVVKVEVWDVVDKGKSRKKQDGLKIENSPDESQSSEPCLDAAFLDVYKGTHGVVMMMDMTKQWTYDYIERELPKVPNHIPVLVLSNHRDMGEHRVILSEDVRNYVENYERPIGSAMIQYAESSMKNGFGLKYLHKFFNIPFLILQRETLMRQLETNQKDIDSTLEELHIHGESEEQNYDMYLDALELKKKNQQAKQEAEAAAKLAAELNDQSKSTGGSNPDTPNSMTPSKSSPAATPGSVTPTKPQPSDQNTAPSLQQRVSRFFSSSSAGSSSAPDLQQHGNLDHNSMLELPVPTMGKVKSVEDFIPSDQIDSSFLEDTGKTKSSGTNQIVNKDNVDSDEEEGFNPMVAGFVEDLDSEDERLAKASAAVAASFNVDISSDEDDTPAVVADDVTDFENNIVNGMASKQTGLLLFNSTSSAIQNAPSNIKEASARTRKSTTGDESDDIDDHQGNGVSLEMADVEDFMPEKTKPKKKTVDSPQLKFDDNDLNFLEAHCGVSKVSTPSTPTTSSVASTKDASSEEEKKSSTKKKKHKEKDRDKDGEKSRKKHKHKKHKDKDKEKQKDKVELDDDKEKKKKKKAKKTEEEKQWDDFEAFLSGKEKPKSGGDYEVF